MMSGESSGFSEFAQGLAQPAFVALDGVVVWANAAWPHSPLQARVVDLFRVDPVAMERTLGFAATRDSVEVDWTPVGMHESLRWTLRAAGGRLYGLSARRQEQTRTDREQMLLMGEQMTRTGFWSIDLASGEAWWSDEVYRIHGYAPASVPAMFQLGLDHYLPEDRARVRAIADYAIASGEPYEFEATLRRTDGELARVQCIGRPERNAATGQVDRLIGAFRDITGSHRTKRIEELQMFAHVAAHDLRGPARTLRSFVDLMFDGIELAPEREAHRQVVVDSADRLLALIDGVGEFARSGTELELSSVCLGAVIRDAVSAAMPDVHAVHGTLDVVGSDVLVIAHPVALRQVVDNLLHNAIGYRDSRRVLTVRLEVDASGPGVELRVHDNGRGIEAEHHDYVFLPFRRVHTDRPGRGVGLTVSRRLAEQCRGRLRVVPQPEPHGTCLELSLLRGGP